MAMMMMMMRVVVEDARLLLHFTLLTPNSIGSCEICKVLTAVVVDMPSPKKYIQERHAHCD
jgi:hypothetical protein